MTNTISFIDTVIRNLPAPKKRTIYWCDGSPGFGIRLSPSGRKSFVFKYMKEGVSRWVSLGRYPAVSIREARASYNDYYKAVHDYGRDPIGEEKAALEAEKAKRSVALLIEDYLTFCEQKGKASIAEEKRAFELDVIPTIGDKLIEEVTPDDIDKIQYRIIKRAKSEARATCKGAVAVKNTLAYLRQLFGYAEKRRMISENPVKAVDSLGKSTVRHRVLSLKEIWLFWHQIENIGLPPVTAKALKFMLCTMQRGTEIRHMRYERLKRDERIWELKAEETKNRTFHRVPLGEMAIQLIEEVEPFTSASPYVFAGTRLHTPPEHPSADLVPLGNTALPQALRKHRDELGIDDIRPHDLRRTGATWMTAVGLPKEYARLILNHSDGDRGVTGEVYVQYAYDFEKRRAIEVWEYVLGQIISCSTVEEIPNIESLRQKILGV